MLIKNKTFEGERSLFSSSDLIIEECIFQNGESPLKESENIDITNTTFKWKYPLWYCNSIKVKNSFLDVTARSGIWYTSNIVINDSIIDAPKTFRRSEEIILNNVKINNALETLWNCSKIILNDVYVNGDYFGFGSTDIECNNLTIEGNYCFDGGKNIVIKNSKLISKDAFWNCENVVVMDSIIVGEYLGWNSKNVVFINCEIESSQGLCYMEDVKLINCTLKNTDLAFEYSSVEATIRGTVDSIKNPTSGTIEVEEVKEIILDEKHIDLNKVNIIVGGNKNE